MAMVGAAIASLARVNAHFQNAPHADADLARLLPLLRDDLHAATAYRLAGDTLTLQGGAEAEYVWRGEVIQRNAGPSRRRFRVLGDPAWEIDEETVMDRRLLTVTFRDAEADAPPRARIAAELGRNQRLVSEAGGAP